MSAEASASIEIESRPIKKLLPIVAAIGFGAMGFASTYLGLWSPKAMLVQHSDGDEHESLVGFVSVPPIEITLSGGKNRILFLATMIETEKSNQAQIEALMPRVKDGFNNFLSGIDPVAFDKRGVLEVIKYELVARATEALPQLPVNDLLITEFRLR